MRWLAPSPAGTATACTTPSGRSKNASVIQDAALGLGSVLVGDSPLLADLQSDPVVATLASVVAAQEPAAVLFAQLYGTPTLSASDFQVI